VNTSTSPLERVNTSTSPLERVNREIERRADVAGVFPDDEAVIRPVGALTLERSDERAAGRRHSGPESLARLADAHSPRPPAVAARGSSDPS
jgi:transposase-like protein